MMSIEAIGEAVKTFNNLAVKPLLAVALASALLLFAPASLIATLGATSLLSAYRAWIGFSLIISSAYLLAHGVVFLATKVRDASHDRAIQKVRLGHLRSLTPDEKGHLLPYIVESRASVVYHITDGVAQGLTAKQILFRSTNAGYGTGFSYNIQPWAREAIMKDPSLLADARQRTADPLGWMGR